VLDAARYGLGNEEVQLRGLFFGLDKEKASVSEIVDALKKTYCSSVGVEFTHVENPEEQTWLARRFEAAMGRTATGATAQNALPAEDKKRILNLLQTSEEFDHFLHTKFRGTYIAHHHPPPLPLPPPKNPPRGERERGTSNFIDVIMWAARSCEALRAGGV
jgi:2-oxoglutarate dehydrogenase complex dehydrogenase (E1) component-like enzyme